MIIEIKVNTKFRNVLDKKVVNNSNKTKRYIKL